MSFLLRAFRAADFDRLWQIDQGCFPDGIAYTQMELNGFILRRNTITIVAEFERGSENPGTQAGEATTEIAGFAIAHSRRGVGRIITLDVEAAARGRGLGTLLMNACETRLKERGCTEVYLEVAVDNEAAIRLYHKLSYVVLRTLPEYYRAHGLDAFLMGKAL